jgi:hypothetical protein
VDGQVHVERSSSAEQRSRLQKLVSRNGGSALSGGDALGAGGGASKGGFLQYCRHEPVILMHHLFIGGFGFLVIVVRLFILFY